MKLEEVMKLTDEQLRVRVAELLGYEPNPNPQPGTGARLWYHPTRMIHYTDGTVYSRGSDTLEHLPDYPNDLNACREMEELLDHLWDNKYPGASAWDEYYEVIAVIVGERGWVDVWKATARQRCEAFVLTMESK